MQNIYKLYEEFDKDGIILSFKGDVTEDLLSSVYEAMEKRQEENPGDRRRIKIVYHILVECLQNVFHHSKGPDGENKTSSFFMIGQDKDGTYRIVTGNNILNSAVDALKTKIDKINAMNDEELRAYYLDKLNSTELSEKGGAGLGMIDIARKSGHKLEYEFHKLTDEYSFFILGVTVK